MTSLQRQHDRGRRARIRVPATTANLGPGFDTLGMALCLYNQVEMWEIPTGLEITVTGEGAGDVADDATNIVYQAALQVYQRLGVHPPGLGIKLDNAIPVARGLGSSAAALVGGLLAANQLTGCRLSQTDLLDLAVKLEGHPDNVAPAILGGLVVSAQTEDGLCYRRITPLADLQVIVAIPRFELSTRESRDVLPKQVRLEDAVFNMGRACLLVTAFATGDLELLRVAMEDRLHQPFRTQLVPGLTQVFQAAKQAGALGVALSGAGPTVIALAKNRLDDIAAAMCQALATNGVDSTIQRLTPSVLGAEILDV